MDRPTAIQIVAATNNRHKLSEIRPLLEPDFRILSLEEIGCHEDLPETGDTLEANALQKASFVFNRYQLPCFADDTGLAVDALNGQPGVYSARYAGPARNDEANIDLLLKNLAHHADRRASFRTVITLIEPAGTFHFEGAVTGSILSTRRGTGGFGYDPVFLPDGYTKTMAELSLQEKNAISHRGRAVRKLIEHLRGRSKGL